MEKYEDKFDFKEFERRQLIAAVVSAKEANIVQEVRKVLRSGHGAISVDWTLGETKTRCEMLRI